MGQKVVGRKVVGRKVVGRKVVGRKVVGRKVVGRMRRFQIIVVLDGPRPRAHKNLDLRIRSVYIWRNHIWRRLVCLTGI